MILNRKIYNNTYAAAAAADDNNDNDGDTDERNNKALIVVIKSLAQQHLPSVTDGYFNRNQAARLPG